MNYIDGQTLFAEQLNASFASKLDAFGADLTITASGELELDVSGLLDIGAANMQQTIANDITITAATCELVTSGAFEIVSGADITLFCGNSNATNMSGGSLYASFTGADGIALNGQNGVELVTQGASIAIDSSQNITINTPSEMDIDFGSTLKISGASEFFSIDNALGVMTPHNGARIQKVWSHVAVGTTTLDVTGYPDGWYAAVNGIAVPFPFINGIPSSGATNPLCGTANILTYKVIEYDGMNTVSFFSVSLDLSAGTTTNTPLVINSIYRMD